MHKKKNSRSCAARIVECWWPVVVSLLFIFGFLPAVIAGGNSPKNEAKADPGRVIQYRGGMPMLKMDLWGTEVSIKFELYRSPSGGTPFWTETRQVMVGKDGWVNVNLGEIEPLPDEAFTTSFRFLAIWHGKIQFIPRKQVASLSYAAAKDEMNLRLADYKEYAANNLAGAKKAAAMAPDRKDKLDAMVECEGFKMEKHPRMPVPWLKAMETARRLGGRLPTFEEWYGAYDGKPSAELVAMAGHYEWVIPWVYEPSIHGRFQELYRGKPAACYYEELNPLNDYPFRLVTPNRVKATP
ncbi:MAG: hypothetical protein JWO08_4727 [Verrucomicrobiaceae bacterium]|nr:hypothetical protein [Verrucomicrobiaceae bacterium]